MSSFTEESARSEAPSSRQTGIPPLGEVPWGSHACQFYDTADDLIEIAIPFIRTGLEGGEFCLWLASDPCGPVEALGALRAGLPDADGHVARGDIEIHDAREWLTQGGGFDADRVVRACREKRLAAIARGYAGMRLHANVAWLDEKTAIAYADYERMLDSTLAGERAIVLCTYPLAGVSAAQVFNVAGTHDFSLGRRAGRWEVLENAELAGIKREIERRNAELEAGLADRAGELAQTQIALHDSEEIYRVLAENTTDVIVMYDVHMQRVYVSPSFTKVFGDIPDRTFAGMHPDDWDAAVDIWTRALRGERVAGSFRHRVPDGTWRFVEATASLVDYRGERHVLAVLRDVSDQRRLQNEMRQAQKLEAIGRLAGGIAHDFNNLLTAIRGYAELVMAEVGSGSRVSEDVGEIQLAAERAQAVTRQLLAFTRRQTPQPRIVDAVAVVTGIERMLRLLLREDIRFEVGVAPEQLPVRVDVIQLEQVLMNLVVNARDAVAPGGHIRVTCHAVPAMPGDAEPAGGYAAIEVIDDGIGMTPDVQARIFEPFFTTKPVGIGTGLGLATVANIVRESGGRLSLVSEPGKGSTFTVALPLVEGDVLQLQPDGAVREHDLDGRSIVVVEDEAVVRHFITDTLTRAGAEVHAFATANQALALLQDATRRVDALITDLILPGMAGIELAERARAARALPVVYMSGYSREEIVQGESVDPEQILQKPFGTSALLGRLATAIGR